jgi:hypothetical protein
MRRLSILLAVCFGVLSCDEDNVTTVRPEAIIGSWRSETVYLNGVNSEQYVDWLNTGSVFIIKDDNTYARNYVWGNWRLCNEELKLEANADMGMADWKYKIIEHTEDRLTLELNLTESQYCCNFDSFTDAEVITIKEVYKRIE